jgi:hypothetical protein
MPGFDRTGPMGGGPMTGGVRGRCNPATAGSIPFYGRGLGLRRGFRGGYGRGYGGGYGWYPAPVGPAYPVDAAEEMDMLKAEADYIKKSLEAVNKRIEELEKEPSEKS